MLIRRPVREYIIYIYIYAYKIAFFGHFERPAPTAVVAGRDDVGPRVFEHDWSRPVLIYVAYICALRRYRYILYSMVYTCVTRRRTTVYDDKRLAITTVGKLCPPSRWIIISTCILYCRSGSDSKKKPLLKCATVWRSVVCDCVGPIRVNVYNTLIEIIVALSSIRVTDYFTS